MRELIISVLMLALVPTIARAEFVPEPMKTPVITLGTGTR